MRRQGLGAAGLALIAAGGLSACQSLKPISQDMLQKIVILQMVKALGEVPGTVHCAGELPASKGSVQECTTSDRGIDYTVSVSVTDDKGSTGFTVHPALPDFPAAKLEESVAADYARDHHSVTPSAVHCADSLSDTIGDQTSCVVTVRGKRLDAVVTVGKTDKKTGITDFHTTYQKGTSAP